MNEIPIGLNSAHIAASLHTVLGTGIVGHAKYDGVMCVELAQLAEAAASVP